MIKHNKVRKAVTKKEAGFFEKLALKVTVATGSSGAIIIAGSLILIWVILGPFFHFSDSWLAIINTGTTITTFLMVFIIQKAQNKDYLVIQLKLNELVAAHELASNRLVSIEDMTEEELKVLKNYYSRMATLAQKETNLQQSHSIEKEAGNKSIQAEINKHAKGKP